MLTNMSPNIKSPVVFVTWLKGHCHCDLAVFRCPFLESPKTFRACEAILNSLYLKNKEVYRHETLHERNLSSY